SSVSVAAFTAVFAIVGMMISPFDDPGSLGRSAHESGNISGLTPALEISALPSVSPKQLLPLVCCDSFHSKYNIPFANDCFCFKKRLCYVTFRVGAVVFLMSASKV
ncbi:MAG TPA: hypothetical protein PLS19_16215, partial [bacterium]|nr:hypothetical protein [bacterium]